MGKHGLRIAIVLIGLTLVAAVAPVQAGGYSLSIAGNGSAFPDLDPGALWGVLPGGTFQVDAVLSDAGLPVPPNPAALHDRARFDVGVTGPRFLIDNAYLWDALYASGGPNDFSVPKVDPGTLLFPAGVKPLITNNLYPATPTRADMHFENTVTVPGQKFGVGTLVTLTLKVPGDAVPGEQFLIAPFPSLFVNGSSFIPSSAGSSLGVVVVPEPATLVLLGLGGLAAIRRRRLRA